MAAEAVAWQAVAAEEDPIHSVPPRAATQAGDRRRLALSTAFFSFATALSRVVGLAREVIAAAVFGVTGVASAFQAAFLVPNLVRALFADAALQAAFVPVFSELLEKGQRREAFRLASTLLYIILLVLGLITGLFILAAPILMPLFAPGFSDSNTELMIGLSRVLFPIVVMLGVTGLIVGMLNSFDHFSVPALAPMFWNLAIIACIVWLTPMFEGGDRLYAYAIGVVLGTLIQMLMPLPVLRRKAAGERFGRVFDWRNPNVRRVLVLMAPVSIGLGLINFDLAVNSIVGSLLSDETVAAINYAFRIFMLPQGIFSVAIATVLFPTLSRLSARGDMAGMRKTVGNGVRQMYMLLVPAAVASAVLAMPIARLVFERGEVTNDGTELVATALFWFAFSLPTSGSNLLYTRTFFALQRPWFPTALAVFSLAINGGLSYAFYKPFGIAGVVGATAFSTLFMTIAQAWFLRKPLGGIEAVKTIGVTGKILVASALLAAVSYGVWYGLDQALGRGLLAQAASLGTGLLAGGAVYAVAVFAMKIEEAQQVWRLVTGRLRRA
ncbi:MAG: murein biosynthesis integral membrane protein MurJ [Actinobacteria bacterium]|nr:murein biosynthesis integral membrane protein MurJ [Actinomycetota bacterium]